MTTSADRRWMRAALTLAQRHRGLTGPNPSVGCVLVAEGRVVARAVTAPGGRPHAEAQALSTAGARAKGATAYVTLEPCAHHGQTPPCATALIEAGIARVVIGAFDPDPRVAGRGVTILRAAGVSVDRACKAQAEEVHRGFLHRQRLGRPFLTLKLATSLDGKIATATGESRWITGVQARRAVHLMRARSDAVLIGRGTAQADAPRLDVRDLGLAPRTPIAVVASSSGQLPPGPLRDAAASRPVWLAHGPDANVDPMAHTGVRGLPVQLTPQGQLDTSALLARLGQEGVNEVLCEGGATLAASLVQAGLVDALVWINAGLSLGAHGLSALGPFGSAVLADAPRFVLQNHRNLGGDVISVWRPATGASSA
ncbi:MAG: bifunctional diaminohydroxyphosphoribosylaminopyrimidine deaminase/5-amino-6-(5-phosphoribosylamino)uracil reductase RibD [Pseudomonadota bacterium]